MPHALWRTILAGMAGLGLLVGTANATIKQYEVNDIDAPISGAIVRGKLYGITLQDTTGANGQVILDWSMAEIPEGYGEPTKVSLGQLKSIYKTPKVVKLQGRELPELPEGVFQVIKDGHWTWGRFYEDETERYADDNTKIWLPPNVQEGVELEPELMQKVRGTKPFRTQSDNFWWNPEQYPIKINGKHFTGEEFNQTEIDSIVAAIDDINERYSDVIADVNARFGTNITALAEYDPDAIGGTDGTGWIYLSDQNNGTSFATYPGGESEIEYTVMWYNPAGFSDPWVRRKEILRTVIGFAGNTFDGDLGIMMSTAGYWTPTDISIGGWRLKDTGMELEGKDNTPLPDFYSGTDIPEHYFE